MKARNFVVLAFGAIGLLLAPRLSAQVVVRGTESSDNDNSSTRAEVKITTTDRSVVPLVKEREQTKIDDNTERTETVTRVRRNDGSYFDAQRSTTIKKQISPDVTEISTAVVEKDRQGQDRTAERKVETVVKTDEGEKSQVDTYARNSSGRLVLARVVDANTVTNANGQTDTTVVEKAPDVSGNIVVQKQIDKTTVQKGSNEKVTTAETRSVDHLTGRMAVTEETTTTVRSEGDTKQINTVVRTPGRLGWEVTGRTTTSETTAPDGSVTREIIEEGRSLYSTYSGNQMMEPLVPQRKLVENETRSPDGTVVVQQDVFRRDVNGDWVPQSFSTVQPTAGFGQNHPAPPPPVAQQPAVSQEPEPTSPPVVPN
ncbi:MAG TPA: hypothetical protein VL171_17985 [Verrucomicrobiae bacterium]|nr:hypothetical protein [Verrucomicrobiae bacterium]